MTLSIKKHIKKIGFTKLIYIRIKKTYTRLKFRFYMLFTQSKTKEDLLNDLKKSGLKHGDKVIINSSLSKIGYIKNGANTVVEALKEYIGEQGLIVMSTYPHTNAYNYLQNYEIFDIHNTVSKNGRITEVFRKGEGVYRSLHPTHPIAAWGNQAKILMQGHHESIFPYDKKSPYKKLLDIDVKIYLIGVDLKHAVMIRIIDDLYDDYILSPYITDKLFHVQVKDESGKILNVSTACHDPRYSNERNNMAIFPYLKDKIIFSKLGKAETWLFSSKDLFNTQIKCSKDGIYPFYKLPLKNRN
jgi:aminoglycoside 3-N-acetyltransferase